MKIPCFIQRTGINIFINHFWNPKIVKMQCQNAKTTEPETIIFLEAQGELAAPLFFMYLIGLAARF
jgi:hypothetical protein